MSNYELLQFKVFYFILFYISKNKVLFIFKPNKLPFLKLFFCLIKILINGVSLVIKLIEIKIDRSLRLKYQDKKLSPRKKIKHFKKFTINICK